jgi:hypothetical protein
MAVELEFIVSEYKMRSQAQSPLLDSGRCQGAAPGPTSVHSRTDGGVWSLQNATQIRGHSSIVLTH